MQAPGQVQRSSGEGSEGSGEGLGGFGAKPGQVQQGSEEGCGERPGEGFRNFWCRARSGSTGSGEGSGEVCFSYFCFLGSAARFREIVAAVGDITEAYLALTSQTHCNLHCFLTLRRLAMVKRPLFTGFSAVDEK